MNPLDAFSGWLLDTTLRVSILIVIILGIRMLLRRWLPAEWRYTLWLPMMLVMVLPVLPSVPFAWYPQGKKESSTVDVVISAPAPVIGEVVSVAALRADKEASGSGMNPLLLIWMAGACIVFGIGWVGYRRHMRGILASLVVPDGRLLQQLAEAADEVGLRKVPRVLISPVVESPAVTGMFRPALLLPVEFPAGFSESEARLILLHEFCHLKRQDPLVNALSCVLQALHWFNPLVWFAFSRMRADRETACDASVLSLGSDDRRADYGSALLKLQSSPPLHGLSLGFVGIFERTADVKSRVLEISSHRPAGIAGRATGLCMVVLLAVFGATKAQEPAPPKEEKNAALALSPGQAAISRKLEAIIIPRIDFENTTFAEAIDFVRHRSIELDQVEPDPSRKGINMVMLSAHVRPDAVDANRITLLRERISLRDALGEICRQEGMEYRVEDGAVAFFKAGTSPGPASPAPKLPSPADDVTAFATGLIIPRVSFKSLTLQEMVESLNESARKVAKGGPVYPIVLGPQADPAAIPPREILVRNVPLLDAVRYCADATGHTWTVGEKEIRLERKPGSGQKTPKAQTVDPAMVYAGRIIIPVVNFRNTPLKDAVELLNKSASARSQGGEVIPITLGPGVDPEAKIGEMRVTNAPLVVLLKYCADATGNTWKAEGGKLTIEKK